MKIKFTKMHGAGNDFIVLDGFSQPLDVSPTLIKKLAHRHFGIGADQVLVVEPPSDALADFRYRIFNADGAEVEQCGNGARCFAKFVVDAGFTRKQRIRVQTLAGTITPELCADSRVSVDMGAPRFAPSDVDFDVAGLVSRQFGEHTQYELNVSSTDSCAAQLVCLSAASMGNPHAVVLVDNVDTAPVTELGPLIERHSRFTKGVNVGFLQIIDTHHARLRVWERGVGETLACGTGACAAAVVGMRMGVLGPSVNIEKRGGLLTVSWQGDATSVVMTGPAETVFHGEIEI